jgi:hypothetical protein
VTPASIAQLLKDYGSSGVAALCICALIWQSRKLDAAHEREIEAFKLTLPLLERATAAVAAAEAKRPRRVGDGVTGSTPGTPNPLTVTK